MAVLGIMISLIPIASASFNDVSSSAWYSSYVETLADQNILSGYSDGTFRPEETLTRAQATKLVVAALMDESFQENDYDHSFSDVYLSAWYTIYIQTAEKFYLIDSANNFEPNESIDRAAFTKLIITGLGIEPDVDKTEGSPFTDVGTSAWYYDYVKTAYDIGLISGYDDGTFQAGNLVNRAEAAKLIAEAQEYQTTNGQHYGSFVDCDDDLSCYAEQAATCAFSELDVSFSFEFGYTINESIHTELQGLVDEKCQYLTIVSDLYFTISDEVKEELLASGYTEEEIEEELAQNNEDALLSIGNGYLCEWDIETILGDLNTLEEFLETGSGSFSGSSDDTEQCEMIL